MLMYSSWLSLGAGDQDLLRLSQAYSPATFTGNKRKIE